MHHLSYIRIENFRSCKNVGLPLETFTPLVGQNNAGKSTILAAIRWLLKPNALSIQDFTDSSKPCIVTGLVEGVTESILARIPDEAQRKAFAPFCPNGNLWIRVSAIAGKTALKQEIWEFEKTEQGAFPSEWRTYPTGITQGVSIIFPEPLSIQAMKDIQKDFTSIAAGTSIKRLIEEIAVPVTAKHKVEIDESLEAINKLLTSNSEHRSEALKEFDDRSSSLVGEFFPGLNLHLELPETKLKEFFKAGTLKVKESDREEWTDFSQLGSGAQRSIEMALIRYLAEEPSLKEEDRLCKLLLIDEPELYLHPQGVRRIRSALAKLATKGFQVIFSTHSPIMLARENTAQTVVVRKVSSHGTEIRMPLREAVNKALADGPSQARALFQLGNLTDIYFADKVVICEGKTDNRLLPLVYQRHYGHFPDQDHVAFVSLGSCSDIRKGMAVLEAMGIKVCAVADLDFAFVEAAKGKDALFDKTGPDMVEVKRILGALQGDHQFNLSDGLPSKGNNFSASDIWALFAASDEGKKMCAKVQNDFFEKDCWIWKEGCIEDVMGIAGKGEEAIIAQEDTLREVPQSDVATRYPVLVECFEWIRSRS